MAQSPEPATDRQKEYARYLGIKFARRISKADMSELIARHLHEKYPPSAWMVELADGMEINVRWPTSWSLSEAVESALVRQGDEVEVATWYLYGVYRHMLGEQWGGPQESGVPSERMVELARQLLSDPKAKASLKRIGPGELYHFDERYKEARHTGSTRTTAYRAAIQILRGELGAVPVWETHGGGRSKSGNPRPAKGSKHSGCFGLIVKLVIGLIAFMVFIIAVDSTWGAGAIWFAAVWAVVTFIRKVTKDADREMDPAMRQALSDELLDLRRREPGAWIPDFAGVFDRVFGKQHIRWRCFRLSVIVSVCAYIVLYAVLARPHEIGSETIPERFALAVSFVVLFNVLVDYISLLETRMLLNVAIPAAARISVDAVVTVVLTVVFMACVMTALNDESVVRNLAEVTRGVAGTSEDVNWVWLTRVVLATSFTTSVWLWLHGIAQLSIKLLRANSRLLNWLDVKETPLRSIGTIINAWVLALGLGLFPFYLHFRLV